MSEKRGLRGLYGHVEAPQLRAARAERGQRRVAGEGEVEVQGREARELRNARGEYRVREGQGEAELGPGAGEVELLETCGQCGKGTWYRIASGYRSELNYYLKADDGFLFVAADEGASRPHHPFSPLGL